MVVEVAVVFLVRLYVYVLNIMITFCCYKYGIITREG